MKTTLFRITLAIILGLNLYACKKDNSPAPASQTNNNTQAIYSFMMTSAVGENVNTLAGSSAIYYHTVSLLSIVGVDTVTGGDYRYAQQILIRLNSPSVGTFIDDYSSNNTIQYSDFIQEPAVSKQWGSGGAYGGAGASGCTISSFTTTVVAGTFYVNINGNPTITGSFSLPLQNQ